MGKEFPRTALSIVVAVLVAAPVILVLFADPSASQANVVTCNADSSQQGATDKPYPDLNVTQVVVKRLDPGVTVTKSDRWYFASQPGDILVEVTVINKGKAAINTGFVVRLEDVRPDGTTVILGDRSVPSLAAGASTAALRYVAENYNATGEHKLRATADATKKIDESCAPAAGAKVVKENNNVGNQSVLLTAKADLRITSLVAKSEVRAFATETASSKVLFNATISNGGNHRAFNATSAASGFAAVFRLNGEETPCKKTSSRVSIRELLPGATKQVEVKCEIAKLTGDFQVSVEIDRGNSVVESNEANNRFESVFSLHIADLASNVTSISGTTAENAVPEFGSMTFTATVRNKGDANATTDDDKKFDWFVYLDEKKDNANNMLANFSTKLAPSASTQATFTVRPLERDLAPGPHKIFVVADSDRAGDTTKGKVIESNTTNNEFVLTFEVARFQLNLTAQGVTKKVSPGIEVRYPFNLTNEGNAKDEVAFTLEGAGVTARVELANGTEVNDAIDVPENETVPLALVVSVPKDAAENTTINVTVLAASTVPKANAGDELTFITAIGPDVVAPTIEKVKPTGDVIGLGGTIELKITDNVAVTSVRYAIGGGATQTAALATDAADTYRIEPPTDEGAFTLSVTALDAKNNRASEEFSLFVDTEAPEIKSIGVVEPAARTTGVDPGAAITITAEITDANMKNATVRVGPSEAVMRQKAGPLWESVNLRAPSTPGEFRIVVYAFDEGENFARAVEDLDRVRVKGVDLELSLPTGAPTNPREGDTVEIRAPVANKGLTSAVGVRVQLIIDGKVADEATVNIEPGATQLVVLQWKAVAGVHTYDVVVDPDDEFTETNELNNEVFLGSADGSIATLFPQARVFTREAGENDFPDLLVRYLWVLLLGLAAVVVGAAAFFVKPA